MTNYAHGGDITAFAKTCACEVKELIDLSSNINFVKPQIDIDFNALDISPYPNYDALHQAIASHYEIQSEELELFNGDSSAIFRLFEHFKGRHKGLPHHCTIYAPAYLEYKKAAEIFEYTLQIIDRFNNFDEEVQKGSLVIFVNPSTPDGMYYDMESLLKKWQANNCTVLIDESFIEFISYTSITPLLSQYENLYILKSLTKFFGAAGIRVGTLISQSNNIDELKKNEPLWKLSTFDSAYIQAVLQDVTFKSRSDIAQKKSKMYLMGILQKSLYIRTIYPSESNYVLVELKGITAKALQEKLLAFKIMIRSCENFDGLGEYHVRIAVKSLSDLSALKEAFHA